MTRIDEMSSLTALEFIQLKATLAAIDDHRYRCSECINTYGSRSDGDTMLAKLKVQKGCTQPLSSYIHKVGGFEFNRCPGSFFTPAVLSWVHLHDQYDKGVALYSEPLLDWPAKAMEILNVIGAEKRESSEKQRSVVESRQRADIAQIRGQSGRR